MNRIPTLDGWRGIAILLVLITHAQSGLFRGPYGGHQWLILGRHGVAIFFVLSGYLITSRLLKEDKIDLSQFYWRRFFRLMPCAWAYLLFLASASVIFRVHLIGSDAWPCLLFFRNYVPNHESGTNALTSHFWSLSLEEQFYIIWPAILAFGGRRRAVYFAAFGSLACAIYRFYFWSSYNRVGFDVRSEVNFDGLLVGCFLALILEHGACRVWFLRYRLPLFLASCLVFVWNVYAHHELIPFNESLGIAAMIACTSLSPAWGVSNVFEWKPLKSLGLISYSLYVWQELFLLLHWGLVGAALLPAIALGSWTYIEQPGILLGRRLRPRAADRSRAVAEVAD